MRLHLLVLLLGGFAAQAKADVIATATEAAGNVVITTNGGFYDLSALALDGATSLPGRVIPNSQSIFIGSPSPEAMQFYKKGAISPGAFGPGGSTVASSGSGPKLGAFASWIYVPTGYVSGTPLAVTTSTYAGQTFGTLGITPGSYQWSWGVGSSADSFTFTAVPEPSLCSLIGLFGWVTFFRTRSEVQ